MFFELSQSIPVLGTATVQWHTGYLPGFWSRSRLEPGYLAGAGAITLARLWLHLKYLFNNSRKLYGTCVRARF